MADKKNYDDPLEKIMNQLAESALGLSDKATRAEISEAGADPQRDAERTRLALRAASKALASVNQRLSNLGHTIDSNSWLRAQRGYHNRCLDCGSFVSFTTTTGEIHGDALDRPCPVSGRYAVRRQEASGR
jgi:hypothetical protein